MLGEIEQCVTDLREFYRRCTVMGSAYALSHANKVLHSLDEDSYGDVQTVKDFKEEWAGRGEVCMYPCHEGGIHAH